MPQFIKPTGSVAPPLQITRPYNLPNARAGQEYSLNLRQLLPELQLCLQLKQPAGVNLDLDTHTGLLTGTPERPGDFNLELSFVSAISKLQQTCTLQLEVIQDPKNLWKNLPSDNSGVLRARTPKPLSAKTASIGCWRPANAAAPTPMWAAFAMTPVQWSRWITAGAC